MRRAPTTVPPVTTLPATPDTLLGDEGPKVGLWAGPLLQGALPRVPGRGRVRRWSYAAAATPDGHLAVGAAVVDLGLVGTSFVWLFWEGRVATWERRLLGGGFEVGQLPGEDARARRRADRVTLSGNGGMMLALERLGALPLHVDLTAEAPCPVVCSTPTPQGGHNVTQKAAGYPVTGQVAHGDDLRDLVGFGWADWTAGRQDRQTTWRWAAGAGTSADGRAVGLNASTGMNAVGPGEDVAWVDGTPIPLSVERLAPVDEDHLDGAWVVQGADGLDLRFEPSGHRSARENLVVVRSAYVQPIGNFRGTIPGPGGSIVEIAAMPGVTEDHEAVW